MLKKTANVDASYGLTPDELKAKVSLSDALIVRSATKVCVCTESTQLAVVVVGRQTDTLTCVHTYTCIHTCARAGTHPRKKQTRVSSKGV